MENGEVRRQNLLLLVQQQGGKQAALADVIGCTPGYLNQLIKRWQGRSMGRIFARRVEKALGKKRGWMDEPHPELWGHGEIPVMSTTEKPVSRQSRRADWIAAQIDTLSDSSVEAVVGLIERLRSLEQPPSSPAPNKPLNVRK